jgi:hypothetical protein
MRDFWKGVGASVLVSAAVGAVGYFSLVKVNENNITHLQNELSSLTDQMKKESRRTEAKIAKYKQEHDEKYDKTRVLVTKMQFGVAKEHPGNEILSNPEIAILMNGTYGPLRASGPNWEWSRIFTKEEMKEMWATNKGLMGAYDMAMGDLKRKQPERKQEKLFDKTKIK